MTRLGSGYLFHLLMKYLVVIPEKKVDRCAGQRSCTNILFSHLALSKMPEVISCNKIRERLSISSSDEISSFATRKESRQMCRSKVPYWVLGSNQSRVINN